MGPWPISEYLVSAKHQFIYIPIPKVACSSVKAWMLDVHGLPGLPKGEHEFCKKEFGLGKHSKVLVDKWLDEYFTFVFVRNPWHRLVSSYHNKFVKHTRLQAAQKIIRTVQRRKGRPVDLREGISFRDFVENLASRKPSTYNDHWKPQVKFLKGLRKPPTFVGKMENMDGDFAALQRMLFGEGKGKPLPFKNKTPERGHDVSDASEWKSGDWVNANAASHTDVPPIPHYSCFYTPSIREMVDKIYARDIDEFGYSFAGSDLEESQTVGASS